MRQAVYFVIGLFGISAFATSTAEGRPFHGNGGSGGGMRVGGFAGGARPSFGGYRAPTFGGFQARAFAQRPAFGGYRGYAPPAHGYGYGHGYRNVAYRRYRDGYYGGGDGGAVALGLFGTAAGTILGAAATDAYYASPEPVYVDPAYYGDPYFD